MGPITKLVSGGDGDDADDADGRAGSGRVGPGGWVGPGAARSGWGPSILIWISVYWFAWLVEGEV